MRSERKLLNGRRKREVLLVAGPPVLLSKLGNWLDAKRAHFDLRVIHLYPNNGETLKHGDERLLGVAAFVLVAEGGVAPSKRLPGLGLKDANGRFVVGAQLTLSSRSAMAFDRAASSVEGRSRLGHQLGPALLLGEWEARARKMAMRSLRCLRAVGVPCFQWTAERVSRESLSEGLSMGAGLALYYGHGRSVGWAGYYGYRARHLPDAPDSPLGAVFSITCSTASRGGGGLSFSERLVARGVCAASLGATRKTRHLSNAYLASSLCEAIASGSARVHDAVCGANLPEDILYSSYRLFGDPTALLVGSVDCAARATKLYAPAPDEAFDPGRGEQQLGQSFSPEVVKEDVDLAELIGLS